MKRVITECCIGVTCVRGTHPKIKKNTREKESVEEEDDEEQMPNMVKVLGRFGFKGSKELSTIEEEEDVIGPQNVEEPEEEEDSRRAEVINEPIQLRRSRRLAEQQKTGRNQCIACDGCVREGTHKKGGDECEEFKVARDPTRDSSASGSMK